MADSTWHYAAAVLAALLAVVGLGCAAAPGRLFSAEFAPVNMGGFGSVNRGFLRVELRDLSGLVVDLATDVDRPDDDISGPDAAVVPVTDRPNAVRAYWLGGMCSTVARMELRGVEDALELLIRDEWDAPLFGGSCPAGGVPRVVAIAFDRPIDADDVAVEMAGR